MRDAKNYDLSRIVEIYNSTIDSRMSTADTEVVTVQSRSKWFQSHSTTRPIFVEEVGGEVKGWISFENFYGRKAYHLTAEISVYVDEQYRKQGVGSRLLSEGITQCPSLGLENLVAFIFSHNSASIKLFEKHGFTRWGELPNVAEMDGSLYCLSILGLKVKPHNNHFHSTQKDA